MINKYFLFFIIGVILGIVTTLKTTVAPFKASINRTTKPPCCKDMLGTMTCQRLLKMNEQQFAKRCNKDAEFRLLQCCTTCNKYDGSAPYDAVAGTLVADSCFDRYGSEFCHRRKVVKSAVKREPKRGKIIKDLPDPKPVVFLKEVRKKKKPKNHRQTKEMALFNSTIGRAAQNEWVNRFESVRVAVEYLASFFYYESTVRDHEVDDFAVTLANSLIDIIYEDSRFRIFTDPNFEKDPCQCFREPEIILDINTNETISSVIIESAKKMELDTWEVSKILPDDLVIVLSVTYCFRAMGYQLPVFMYRGLRCHIGAQVEKLELEPVLRRVTPGEEHSRPRLFRSKWNLYLRVSFSIRN
ncbi:hypothetical protein FO519_005354 [Halicephalobus sp. NKZ332]|nr:hypothetical protein FO519_005354 [Halicephalobus sp. NKZ332]